MHKKIRSLIATLALVGLLAGGLGPVRAQGTSAPDAAAGVFKAGEVLVRFRPGASTSAMANVLSRHRATRIRSLYQSDVELWQVPEGQELATVEQLNAEPAVEYAEPNYARRAFVGPNDPHFGKQWAHTRIQSEAAWDIGQGSTSITVAIIDTGIDETHPDLASKIVAGYDFVDNDANPHDLNGHGTHCAGIAAALANNGVGVAGIDWRARIMPIRVLDAEGGGWDSDIADGITWAYQHGAKVLSLSLGGPGFSQTMQNAVNNAHAAGSLVVAAMGNDRTDGNPTSYPAACANVMAVAATAPDDTYSYFSQYGSHCDIAAPGGEMGYLHDPDGIYSTMPTYPVYMNTQYGYSQNYDYVQGTSQATPYVAGLASLVWSVSPALTPDQVQNVIQTTAVDLGSAGWDQNYGHGRINALAALQSVSVAPSAPTLSPISNPDGDGAYTVDWSNVTNATSYTLQEDDNAAFASPTTRYTGANSQYAIAGQGPGVWTYRVRASNGQRDSAWSVTQSVGVVPGAPTLLAISNGNGDGAYTVDWNDVSGATGYTLQEDDNASFTSPAVRYVGAASRYDVTGQSNGTWYYRAQATNAAGSGSWSATQSTIVTPPPLGAPVLAAIGNGDGDGEYLVDWTDVPTATSYILEESPDSYFASSTEMYSGTVSQFAVTGQTGGTWHYRVRAAGPPGQSPWSNQQSAVVWTQIYLPLVAKNYYSGGTGGWTTIVSQDFEGTWPGAWIVFDDDALTGSYYWGKRNCRAYGGSYSGWAVGAGDGAGLSCGSDYPRNVVSWMAYGPFNLADASAAELNFQLWLNCEPDFWDYVFYGASTDGANFYGWSTSGNSAGWVARTLDLTNVPTLGDLTGQPNVWVALVFVSDGSIVYPEGAYVDDVVLRKSSGAAAAAGQSPAPATLLERPASLSVPR